MKPVDLKLKIIVDSGALSELSGVVRAANKKALAEFDRQEKERIQIQNRYSGLEMQFRKRQADEGLRIQRQAAVAEASLVLDRFDRRIAIERVKHNQILQDVRANDAAVEAEKRRHQAVVGRIQMDQGNFANTPFQKMLENFNKLNNGLGKFTPAMGAAASTIGLAGGAAGAFGGALTSLTMGPVGIAIVGITALSAGINKLIGEAERAASLQAGMGESVRDPAKLQALIESAGKVEQAKARLAKGSSAGSMGGGADAAMLDAANRKFEEIAGKRYESEGVWNLRRLKQEQDAQKRILDAKRTHNEDAKRLDEELTQAKLNLIQNDTARALAAEQLRYDGEKRMLADHKENLAKNEQLHATLVQGIKDEAARKQKEAREKEMDEAQAFEEAAAINNLKREEKYKNDLQARRELAKGAGLKLAADENKTKRYYQNQDEKAALDYQRLQGAKLGAAGQFFHGIAALAAQANMKEAANRKRWKALAITEVIINTGRAIMQVAADRDLPTYAKVAAGIGIGVFGLAQANQIREQQFYGGGYTGPGNPRDAAGIVHKEEYVVPHGDLARAGGPAGIERMLQGGGGFTHTGNVSININLPAGSTPAQAREATAAAAEGYMKAMRKHAARARDVAFFGVQA